MTSECDLASRWLGASVIAASDESFGEQENLLTLTPAAFEPGRYGNRGEIVDGWATRHRRSRLPTVVSQRPVSERWLGTQPQAARFMATPSAPPRTLSAICT